MKDQRILIAGATSPIARALARLLAQRGAALFLASRDLDEVYRIASDIEVRVGVDVHCGRFEAAAFETHAELIRDASTKMGGLTGVVMAAGMLGDPVKTRTNPDYAVSIMQANYLGPASLLSHAAIHFEAADTGFIVGIGSVAGDRGRRNNYEYGSAKGAFALFMQGLRSRLNQSGMRVLTVKPGFVDTGMTWGMPGLFLVASPKKVAIDIVHALDKRKDVIYSPPFWRWIMLVIRMVPEKLFKRLSI